MDIKDFLALGGPMPDRLLVSDPAKEPHSFEMCDEYRCFWKDKSRRRDVTNAYAEEDFYDDFFFSNFCELSTLNLDDPPL